MQPIGLRRLSRWLACLTGWRRFAVAVSAGAASSLALAPLGWFPILWITFPVFVWLLDGAAERSEARRFKRLLAAGLIGWSFGFGYFVGGLWWLGAAFLVEAAEFAWALPLVVAAFPAGLALFWALGAGAACLLWRPGWRRVLVFAVAMTAAEWLRGVLLTGFPWNAVGYGLATSTVMMQSASIVGLWGLTFAAFFIFGSPAALAGGAATHNHRRSWVLVAFGFLLMAAHVGFGVYRLGAVATEETGLQVRIVQPSLKQEEKWNVSDEEAVVQRYLDLSLGEGGLHGIDILVWPESAFPFLLAHRADVLEAIGGLLPARTVLITGAARGEPPQAVGETGKIFNSIQVVDDSGQVIDSYDKVHLVPFGEYLPLRSVLEALGVRQLVAVPQGFSKGNERASIAVDGLPTFIPLICYEIIFPGEVVVGDSRPGWLLNVTNDGWFGDTPGPYQHFQQARLRAVEEGLPLVRAANTGISAIVDPLGRTLAATQLGDFAIIDGVLPKPLEATIYARVGGSGIALLLLLTLVLAVVSRRNGLS